MTIDITQPTAELFDTTAEAFAKSFRKPESSQLRRFYDELVRFDQLARQKGDDEWKNILPLVKMMNAKVAYAHGRKHVDNDFYTAFTGMIRQISEAKHLTNCKQFLEATIGFRKLKEELDKGSRR